jgi:NAD(P)-dependent dehydrogenase (short-subunit alcohol dehydrogenase family)
MAEKRVGLLDGMAAVVAGSSRGIGRAVAQAFASEGASVVVNGRAQDAVDAVVEEILRAGGKALAFVGSVADFETAAALIAECREGFGAIDVLVNCTGTAEPPGSSILDLPAEAWSELIDSHLTATFNTCRHAAPAMVAQGRGAIVNTSSHAYLGTYGGTGYPAGKGGVNSLTFAMAAELRAHGVRVNAVCPGARTRLSTGPDYEAKIHDLHARGILNDVQRDASLAPGDPRLVGPLYAFLASDAARGLTGRIFSAAGGYVGLHRTPGEERMLAYRAEGEGPWPAGELAQRVLEGIEVETS